MTAVKEKTLWRIFIFLGPVLLSCGPGFANVTGSQHDMFAMGKGTNKNVCSYCHIPHNAIGKKIWSNWNKATMPTTFGPSGNTLDELMAMCYTCHDGTVTSVGLQTVFNWRRQSHRLPPDKGCALCHSVHDNSQGKFLRIGKTKSAVTESATYCETCHGATPHEGAEDLGDHLAGSEHPYKDAGHLLDESCNSCHSMHNAEGYYTDRPGPSKPILKKANRDSVYCMECHPGYQWNGDRLEHPTNLYPANLWGRVPCESCHDVHQPKAPGRPFGLMSVTKNGADCESCHETSTTPPPRGGGGMEEVQPEYGPKGPKLPWNHPRPENISQDYNDPALTPRANQINDDGVKGPDYPGAASVFTCESCHSVHKKGREASFLRRKSKNVCDKCHFFDSWF